MRGYCYEEHAVLPTFCNTFQFQHFRIALQRCHDECSLPMLTKQPNTRFAPWLCLQAVSLTKLHSFTGFSHCILVACGRCMLGYFRRLVTGGFSMSGHGHALCTISMRA